MGKIKASEAGQAGKELSKSQVKSALKSRSLKHRYQQCRKTSEKIARGEMLTESERLDFENLFENEDGLHARQALEESVEFKEP